MVEVVWRGTSITHSIHSTKLNHHLQHSPILPQPSLTNRSPHYLNHQSRPPFTLPQPSLTDRSPHYFNHHSPTSFHATSIITHLPPFTLPQPSLIASPPHYLYYHSQLHTTSTITHNSRLPQSSLRPPHYLNHHSHPSSLIPQPSLTP